jgi:hypothetical protein
MRFPHLSGGGQLPMAGATLQIFDTIKSLNPAKGDFCINGSQSF